MRSVEVTWNAAVMMESSQSMVSTAAQVRRAWSVVGVAFAVFAVLTASAVSGGFWVYRHATEPEVAILRVISGNGALVRSPTDSNWRLATGDTRVREGDRVSTALGTVAWLTMFDGSTVEVTEDTILRVDSMRSSRFLRRTKLIVLEPLRGTIYVSMTAHQRYRFSETIVRRGNTTISMVDGAEQSDAGSFLVEVRDVTESGIQLRIAVLSGAISVATRRESRRLIDEQQVNIGADGTISPFENAVRELINNGAFTNGLNGWVEYQKDANDVDANGQPAASVELVPEQTTNGPAIAVELLRASDDQVRVETGIRQRIAKTLRVHSSLVLDLEVKISDQLPLGGGEALDTFPLIVELNYLDIDGAERQWRHGYYALDDPNRPVPDEVATEIDRDEWQRIIFDLHNLDPLPGQITSIVLYASGQRYATRVANLSLSSSEIVDPATR